MIRNREKRQIIKNVGSSWFSLGINILVGIFLSPFILHRLGDAAFGIWVLVFSLTGYYGIFDFGIRSSVIRYVSKYTATGDIEEVSGLINTALFSYSCVGVLTLLTTAVGCIYIDRLFHIPLAFHTTARWLLFVVGTSVALGFPLGVFGGMLEGLQKFYILNWTNIAFSSILRTVLIVFFLNRGYGLLTVALITVGSPFVTSLIRAAVALRSLPIHFSWKYINRDASRHMANYSGVTFMILIAWRLRFKTDAVVIGTLLSSAAITYFYAGSRLVDYAGDVVSSLAQIFVPMSSQSDAAGDREKLRKIFVAGNRACALVILPITATFIILGRSIIEVWVGQRYVAQGYPVLLALIIPYTLMTSQGASSRILFGMSKHGKLAVVTMIEGIANLVLSLALVRPLGVLGDALGTTIPMLATYLVFMPRHLCARLEIRIGTYLRHAYSLPLLLSTPVVAVLLLMRHWTVAHNYRQLAVQLLVVALVYAAALGWAHSRGKLLAIGKLRGTDKGEREVELLTAVEALSEDS